MLLALPFLVSAAWAADAPAPTAVAISPFHGKLTSAQASGSGTVTIDRGTIEVEVTKLFGRESHSFALQDVKTLHVRRGVFHAWVDMLMHDGSAVRIRTKPDEYDMLRAALKARITKV